jgi:hypothetical protein
MSIRVVDKKKVDMTEDEWALYQKICKSYTIPPNKGEDMFIDLFETDENGVIMFLKPPSKRGTSFEVFMFLMALQQQQHIRLMYAQVADFIKQTKDELAK